MDSQTKYFKYGLVILAIICVALFTGKYLSKTSIGINTENSTEQLQDKQSTALEDADYIATPPTFGPIIRTQSIEVGFQSDQATGFLTTEKSKKIAAKQDVILFDKEDYVLPLGGKVTGIENSEDSQQKIIIALPEGTNTQFLSNTLDIIILETAASKRLPLSAIQQDENKNTFVWVAHSDDENATTINKAQRLYIGVGISDTEYFEEDGHKIESFTPVIINPDNKIKPDKNYNIVATEIEGPLHNPIRQAWVDYEVARLETQQEDLQRIADECASGKKRLVATSGATTLADGTQTGGGCGQASNAPLDPIDIFNSLINNIDGQSGCSSNAKCGQ